MRNTRAENLSEHTLEVCYIAHALGIIGRDRLSKDIDVDLCLKLAMYHDVPEIVTGDMPTPVKYHNDEIKKAYRQVESVAVSRLLHMMPKYMQPEIEPLLCDSTSYEARLTKAADKLSGLIHCIEEEKAGNREFLKARATIEKSLRDMNIEECDIFMKEFIKKYNLGKLFIERMNVYEKLEILA